MITLEKSSILGLNRIFCKAFMYSWILRFNRFFLSLSKIIIKITKKRVIINYLYKNIEIMNFRNSELKRVFRIN